MRTVIEICEESRERGEKFMDMFVLMDTKPGFHGPLVHRETGESYQAMDARSEYEATLKKREEHGK
jgi:hypothetical protein